MSDNGTIKSTVSDTYTGFLKRLPQSIGDFALYAVNWLVQGQLFATWSERSAKAVLEAVGFVSIYTTLRQVTTRNRAVLGGILGAHTLNWIAATNIHSTRIKRTEGTQNTDAIRAKFAPVVRLLESAAESNTHIYGIGIFGSFARGDAHLNSDLDAHIYRKRGIVSAISTYVLLFKLRLLANYRGYPLDVWVEDRLDGRTAKDTETPILIGGEPLWETHPDGVRPDEVDVLFGNEEE